MTTTLKHTSGPWEAVCGDTLNPDRPWGVVKYLSIEECREIDGDDAQWPSRTVVLAEVTDGDTAEADAKLMATAPEMLAAIESLLACIDADWGADFIPYNLAEEADAQANAAVLAARAAIAKAKGGAA